MTSLARLVRWRDWGTSKLPSAFAGFALIAVLSDAPARDRLVGLAAAAGFVGCFLAFGHLVNDFADQRTDRAAGKPNAISGFSPCSGIALLVGSGALSVACVAPWLTRPYVGEWVALNLASALAYSLPPTRLKERGAAGLFAAALAQRTLPFLLAAAMLDVTGTVVWIYAALLTLVGVRWILLHQVIDLAKDGRSGTRTWVTGTSQTRAMAWVRRLFAAELLTQAAWVAVLWDIAPWVALLPVTEAAWYAARCGLLGGIARALRWDEFWLHPLGDVYGALMPLYMSLGAAFCEPALWPLPAVLVLLCGADWARKLGAVARMRRASPRGST